MKRLIISLIIISSAFATANAQFLTNNYKDLKNSYNRKEYVKQATDPYNPALYDLASFFVPGSGQLLMGETWRGLAFMGGEIVLVSIITDAVESLKETAILNEKGFVAGYTDEKKGKTSMAVLLSALAADLGLSIWSSIDAGRIAKVKNMHYQSLLTPTVVFTPTPSGSQNPSAGFGLQIRF